MRHLFATALVLLTACAAAVEGELDRIQLTNGHRIHGVIDLSDEATRSDETAPLLVTTRSGSIALPRELIASIDYGFENRRLLLAADDLAGHIELARWAMANNRSADAYQLLIRFASHPDLDVGTLRLLARLTDELRGAQEAIDLYRRYRDAGGNDAPTLARLADLEDALARHAAAMAAWQREQAEREPIAEGLESQGSWASDNPQWANPTQVQPVRSPTGNTRLRIAFQGGEHHKASARYPSTLDVRGQPILRMHVLNPGERPAPMSIAVKTGDQWTYFESRAYNVPADNAWHTIDFDLAAADFKCAASQWQPNTTVADPDDVKELQIQVHNGNGAGEVYIDGIGFLASP